MKKNRTILTIVAGVILTFNSTYAFAEGEVSKGGLFIEPAVTYEVGHSDTSYPAPFSDSTGDLVGFGLGARLGFHLNEAFFIAADARYSMPQYKDSNVTYDAKSTASNWGAVVGMQMPDIGIRIWGTYIVGGELDPEQSGSFDVKFAEASGYRAGLGFHIQSLSVNLEYQRLSYGKATLEQAGPFTPGTFDGVDMDNDAWVASVSFPYEF